MDPADLPAATKTHFIDGAPNSFGEVPPLYYLSHNDFGKRPPDAALPKRLLQ